MSRGYFRERGREDVLSENEAEVASTACLDFLKTGRKTLQDQQPLWGLEGLGAEAGGLELGLGLGAGGAGVNIVSKFQRLVDGSGL